MVDELKGKTVVICEDEGNMLMFLARILKQAGMKVVGCATDGRDGIGEVLRERPHIVLMDIQLPNLDGIEAIRRILRTYTTYQPCVIVITAYGDDEHRRAASEAGAKGFLEKPVDKHALLAEIRRVMEAEECGIPASEGEGLQP